jgi:alkanesulfonate monooxygenase SsuD/methylene tetrahydromethanopterin reductase-like flavin-dependent oxidoreductase (luciferase family)
MEFGILFTSHPNHATEPYPHREVHARVTAEIEAADALGYDTAWVAEHHFSNTIRPITGTTGRSLRLFAERVMPEFRRA